MLKKMAWNIFKNTGNINTMMELLEVNHLEDDLERNVSMSIDNTTITNIQTENLKKEDDLYMERNHINNGDKENKRNCNFGK